MTAREWKPGAVARTKRGGTVYRTARGWWVLLDDGHSITLDHEPRPLVVIDPEDREQVERLADIYWGRCGHNTADAFQRALREFANPTPPKPAEPTGDGAVVLDSSGYRWVRIASQGEAPDSPPWRHRGHTARAWDHINAVTVLSEGVQP